MNPSSYFFASPDDGPYLTALAVGFAALFLVGLGAWAVSRRAHFGAVRKRARQLRSIAFWAAIPGALYIQARHRDISGLELRIWLYVILTVFAVRLLIWALRLRAVATEKVDERAAKRKRNYFQPRKRPKPRRKRR